MIRQLRIQNFALIKDWTVEFESGEIAFTGETASGKSLFVGALSYLAGGRLEKSTRRDPDKKLRVSGVFSTGDISFLKEDFDERGIPWEEDGLIVVREMTQSGNRQWINDRRLTLTVYKELMGQVMDIHSQNAQSILTSRANYLPLLDQYLGPEAEVRKDKLRQLLDQMDELDQALAGLDLSPEELAREEDLLQYQVGEIREAHLEELDEEALNQEYKVLTSAKERMGRAQSVLNGVSGGSQPLKFALQDLAQRLDELASKDPGAEKMKDLAWQISTDLESLQMDLEEYIDSIVIDPARIASLDAYFSQLQMLRRKYGQDTEKIIQFADQAEARLDELKHIEDRRKELEKARQDLEKSLAAEAKGLSQARQAAGRKLETKVRDQLQEMAVKKVVFKLDFSKRDEIGPNGYDRLDFLISTNPGQPLQSVSKVASGGEMSRFMLALKIIASEIQGTPILVFDEIDTGLSGRTAQVVAQKLAGLSRSQVFVISHLPQISALANHHFRIRKLTEDGETYSVIKELGPEDRVEELARLIGGVNITEVTRKSAREMLVQADQFRADLREDVSGE